MALVKYLMLMPLNYNDGSEVPQRIREEFEDQIYVLLGGITAADAVRGAYRMKSGEKQIDYSQQLWMLMDESEEDVLAPQMKELVRKLASQLGQESIYLERSLSSVEFVTPGEAEGQ